MWSMTLTARLLRVNAKYTPAVLYQKLNYVVIFSYACIQLTIIVSLF